MSQTHYETLEISESATQEEIKRAYRRLAKKYHPDRNKGKGAEENFKAVNEAYQVLGDPDRRRIYDYDLAQFRKNGGASAAGSAQTNAPPPPPPPPRSSGAAGGKTSAPPPPAQQPYRYLFFLRGLVVGGGAVAALLALSLILYVSYRRRQPAAAASAPIPQQPTSAVKQQEPPASTPQTPKPTPATSEPTPPVTESRRLREPAPPSPTPTPGSTPVPAPTHDAEAEAPSASVHICGRWRGSFDWRGRSVLFVMVLERRGSDVSGDWTETHDGRIWRASIRGFVDGTTVSLVKRYLDNRSVVRFVSSDSSADRLAGNWENSRESGRWRAAPEKEPDGRFRNEPRRIDSEAAWRNRRQRSVFWP